MKYFLGETEDDLENNKKELRPKRTKNENNSLRPASAASGTSVTSEDRRDAEEGGKRLRDHDGGKQTPDSFKLAEDKAL